MNISAIDWYLAHNKITSQKELEHLTKLPILGSIPYFKKDKSDSNRLIIDKYPKSELSEAFRSMRTNMEFINGSKSTPIICITSSIEMQGSFSLFLI